MSDDLDMAKVLGNYGIFRQVCSVYHAVETSKLRVELGPAEQLNQNGDDVGSERRHILQELMAELTLVTQHDDPVNRRAAVTALGEAALCSDALASEVEASLINLMPHEDEETLIAVVNALGRMASRGTPRLVEALIRQLADARPERERVTSEILVALQRCDPLASSQAVPSLVGIIECSDRSENVRIAGCATLGAIGEEAIAVIPDLLIVSKNIRETANASGTALAHASASAIARIDPEGLRTVAAVESLEDLERVRQLLLTSGDTTDRHLASRLNRRIAELTLGPPAGRQRMLMKDIINDIFGTVRGNADTRRKKVLSWIAKRTLPGMHISHGFYDVDTAILERLKQRHCGEHDTESP